MAENRWKDIFIFLKGKGYSVYSPGTKVGECTEPYIVVKFSGYSKHVGVSSLDNFYTLLLYVPVGKYSELDSYVMSVRNDMKEMEPKIMPYDVATDSYLDETIKAHMVSLTYLNYKKK